MHSRHLVSSILFCLLSLPSVANAVEFSVLGPSTITINPGEIVTIDLAVDNASQTENIGVIADLTGLAASGAVVIGGQSALHYFVSACLPSDCFGGVDTVADAFFDPDDLSAGGLYTPGDDSVRIVYTQALSSTTQDGSLDPGLDGALDVPSARDVTIMLQGVGIGVHVLEIDEPDTPGGGAEMT